MRWILTLAGAASLLGASQAQDEPADSKVYVDSVTGFTFSAFDSELGVSYRIARPDPVAEDTPYDIVYQILSPIEFGWNGIGWGGGMTYNPLTLVWPNDKDVTVSSRMAFGYYVPPLYEGAKYEVLSKGTWSNATHYQATVKCTGCSTWGDDDIGVYHLLPNGQNYLAFAQSRMPVDEPSNVDSTFSIHQIVGHWVHDFKDAANPGFDDLVAMNK